MFKVYLLESCGGVEQRRCGSTFATNVEPTPRNPRNTTASPQPVKHQNHNWIRNFEYFDVE